MPYPTIHVWLALACLSAPLSAQSSIVVTMASVGDRVRAQNPDLTAARLRIREAMARTKQAGRLSNPTLETSYGQNVSYPERSFEIGFSQRFPVTNRLRLEKELSATELASAETEVKDIERRLQAEGRELVVKILANRQNRELLNSQKQLADQFAEFLSAASSKGEMSPLDAGQAKLDAAGLNIRIRQADAEETCLLSSLKPLLGMRPDDALVVSGTLPPPTMPPSSKDPSGRPDLEMARLEVKSASQNVALEESRRYEDIEGGIFAGADRNNDTPKGYDTDTIVGLRIQIPLPLWNKNEAVIEEAVAKKERKESEANALARTIILEAQGAEADMKQWLALIREIENQLLPLAEAQATLAETSYRTGQTDIEAVLRSREKKLELATARLEALREFHLARIRHAAALNRP